MDRKVDSEGIINTSSEPQEFLDQILEMMTLEVEDKNKWVEYWG